jgi:hypothetical protein
MLKMKVLSLVATTMALLSLLTQVHVHAQDGVADVSSSMEGGYDATNSCANDDGGGNSSAETIDQKNQYVMEEGENGNPVNRQIVEENETKNDRNMMKGACEDKHESCSHWSNVGECSANPNYMRLYCQRSCGVCFDQEQQQKM